jgi:hypothetical protein
MSLIEKNTCYIALSKGEKYGIKPFPNNGIELPFNLADESEVKKLENELKRLFPIVYYHRGTNRICIQTKKKHWYSNRSKVSILSYGNSVIIDNWYDKEGLKALDTILVRTILFEKLKDYLKQKKQITDDEAGEIIKTEIAPLASV